MLKKLILAVDISRPDSLVGIGRFLHFVSVFVDIKFKELRGNSVKIILDILMQVGSVGSQVLFQ